MPRRAGTSASAKPAVDRSLKVGDHAYLAPPCSERECAPYCIVRIVDIPKPAPGEVPKVKVAYYLRRRDVTNRPLADHRVIFATFTDGLVPLSHIRQKVQVMFRDYLEDPEAFKRQPDCFVFSQIYDRFMHKPFDLVPTSQVLNAPDKVLTHLKSHYEFVCTETSTAVQLSDAMRGCVACHEYAAKDESVSCAMCSRTWHLRCTEPPLLKKPALGWKWSCIKCTMQQAEDDSDSDSITTDRFATRVARNNVKALTLQKNGKLEKGKGPALEVQLDVAKWRMTDGWPFRYFGLHLHFDSILDPHDPIWPRASTNVGSRYQVSDIPGDEPESSAFKRRGPVPKRRGGRKAVTEEEPELERGGNATVDLIWSAATPGEDLERYEYRIKQARQKEVDQLRGNVDMVINTLAWIQGFRPQGTVPSHCDLPPLLSRRSGCDYWSTDSVELECFSQDLEEHGDDLMAFSRCLKSQSMPQIVHRFYRHHAFGERFMHADDPERDIFAAAGPQGSGATQREVVGNDDGETSVVEDYTASLSGRRVKRVCAICGVDSATVWYKCPEGLGEAAILQASTDPAMCPSCSIQWRHYGNGKPAPTELEIEIRASKDGKFKARLGSGTPRSGSPGMLKPLSAKSMSKETKLSSAARALLGPMKSCVLCKRPEPKALNYECVKCGVVVHTQCYGIEEGVDTNDWKCDVCQKFPDLKEYKCRLCPVTSTADAQAPRTALDALKPIRTTPDRQLSVHLICAIWHAEMFFTNENTLDTVDDDYMDDHLYLEIGEQWRFRTVCTICKIPTDTRLPGAVVKCDCCDDFFHVGCAWRAGYRFAFEINRLKAKYNKHLEMPSMKFKDEEGDMSAIIVCKKHSWDYGRRLYELGQKDRITNLTTLMAYCKHAKYADFFESYPGVMPLRLAQSNHGKWCPTGWDWGPLPEAVPDTLSELYEKKEPYVRPMDKVSKKKKVDHDDHESTPPANTAESMNYAMQENSGQPLRNTNGEQKRKRPSPVATREYYDYSSLSEDEVMPSATTSRARNAARPTRGVTLKDLLVEEHRSDETSASQTTSRSVPLTAQRSTSYDKAKIPAAATSAPLPPKIAPRPSAVDTRLASSVSGKQAAYTAILPGLTVSGARRPSEVHGAANGHFREAQSSKTPAWQALSLSNLTHAYYAPLYRHQQLQQIANLRQSFFDALAIESDTPPEPEETDTRLHELEAWPLNGGHAQSI